MCVTDERQSTICGHVARYTNPCINQKSQSVLKIFYRKCNPTIDRVCFYEICHGCRIFWERHGVTESEAIEQTLAYRRKTNYHGTVSPHSYEREKPYLMHDINIHSTHEPETERRPPTWRMGAASKRDTNLTEFLVNGGENAGTADVTVDHENDLTEWLVKHENERSSSAGSRITLWPSVRAPETKAHKAEEDNPDYLPHPDEFELDDTIDISTDGSISGQDILVNPRQV